MKKNYEFYLAFFKSGGLIQVRTPHKWIDIKDEEFLKKCYFAGCILRTIIKK